MVLHGGTVRTLDAARRPPPRSSCAATASPRCSTTCGTRRPARPASTCSGGCLLPGFTDAHVHFPAWALARCELQLQDAASLAEAVDRVARAAAGTPPGTGCAGAAGAAGAVGRGRRADPRDARRRHAGRARRAACPRRPLPVAELRRPRLGGRRPGRRRAASWSATPPASRPGSCARRRPGASRRAPSPAPRRRCGRCATRCRPRRPRAWSRSTTRTAAATRPSCSPHCATRAHWRCACGSRCLPSGSPATSSPTCTARLLRIGYVKAFMDGTLGSRTARMLDGTGVEITSRGGAGGDRAARVGGGLRRRRARDRRPRQPRGARRLRGHTRRTGSRAGCARGSSTRSASTPTTCRASRASASPPRCSTRTRRATATSPTGCGATAPRTPIPTRRCWRRARCSPAARTRRWRPSTPSPACGPRCCARTATGRRGGREQAIGLGAALASFTTGPAWLAGEEHVRGRIVPGLLADLVVLDRDPVAGLEDARVAGTMLAGKWTLTPPGSA